MSRTIFLELNEINFDYVEHYIQQGRLPGFKALMEEHGVIETEAEQRYEELEPWIQWVTVHSGRAYRDHEIFRLGDIVGRPVPQFFEELESKGHTVGAISPMNAENRLQNAPYFVPDPWTPTEASGSPFVRRLARAVSEAVNANAHGRVGAGTLATVLAGLARFASPRHYGRYASLIARGLRHHWPRAMLLDLLLFDVHNALFRKHRPDLSVLFLNAGAHIQHHYFFNSPACEADRRNPDWYVEPEADPVYEIYELYDMMLRDVRQRFPESRLIVATGLRQVPYPEVTYYYRFTDHADFLQRAGIPGVTGVEPRMSRDFLVHFDSAESAAEAERLLRAATDDEERPLFEEADNRGTDMFVTLTYPHEITPGTTAHINGRTIEDLAAHTALVAIKNGHHHTTGYVIDTAETAASTRDRTIPLPELHDRIVGAV
ncbi:hypothetical protein SAMN05660831_00270 [Thiohalospira halophila DSM 15071]|uniref:Type I phosphodiesterase / nucleotide pyrophosphatase n=1 Tax=Thiohalospira halophila DSM 15071 TaxID=1123397 RepID=A0A1I1NSQ7_9GAMM|nr:hypothetical protein [Thiohalospira halophila]SFC96760.1 hypothetical protein SAMN05660831_00270 [Thiohalospira halophila DSM 15071]